MIVARRWVLYRKEKRQNEDGKRKWTKIPYQINGRRAKSNDPRTWASYNEVLEAFISNGTYDGIGFMLGDGWAGIDLDNSLRADRKIKPWAQEYIDNVLTYAEISPSGKGIKAIGYAKHRVRDEDGNEKDAGTRKVRKNSDGEAIEIYFGGRFFAITGNAWPGHPLTVEDVPALVVFYDRLTAADQNRNSGTDREVTPNDFDDDELIRRAGNARNGAAFKRLMQGDTSGYNGDDSAADMALCNSLAFWTGRDASRMDKLFRRSGLMRAKWNEKHYSNGDTYGSHTIGEAIAKCREVYTPPAPRDEFTDDDDDDTPAIDLQPVALGEIWRTDPTVRPYVIDGLLRRGGVGNIVSVSKGYKTYLVLNLAITMAMGGTWLDCFQTAAGKVLIIDMELQRPDITRRTQEIARAMHVSPESIADKIQLLSLRGQNVTIVEIERLLLSMQPGAFVAVIIDPLYKVYPADFDENSNAQMTALYRRFERLAEHLDSGLILIHHTSKGAQDSKRTVDVGAGAGAQARSPDWHAALREHEMDGCVVFDAKVRSFQPPPPLVLEWDYPLWRRNFVLDPTALRTGRKARDKKEAEPKEVKRRWTIDEFVTAFLSDKPRTFASITVDAAAQDLSQRKAKDLLEAAIEAGKAHRWTPKAKTEKDRFATVAPALFEPGSAGIAANDVTPETSKRKARKS